MREVEGEQAISQGFLCVPTTCRGTVGLQGILNTAIWAQFGGVGGGMGWGEEATQNLSAKNKYKIY